MKKQYRTLSTNTQKQSIWTQLLKYSLVGVGNTFITAVVIWLMLRAGSGDIAANIVGFGAGLVNSFIWNRRWTFRSARAWRSEFVLFLFVFAVCYVPQLLLVSYLNHTVKASDWATFFSPMEYCGIFAGIPSLLAGTYANHLAGMVFFTILNFILNKFITFRR